MNERQRREALGVGLVALGVLVMLALLPQLLPGRTESGNLIGPAGELLSLGLNTVFGAASVLVGLPAFVWALWCFGILEQKTAVRWSVLSAGAMLFVPAGWWFLSSALGGTGNGAGWLGGAMAGALTYLIGTFGLTAAYNVPRNNRLEQYGDSNQGVEYWPTYRREWTRANHVRTAAGIGAALLLTLAVVPT